MAAMLWFLAYVGALLSAANAAWYALSGSDPGFGAYLGAAVLAFIAVLAVHGFAIGARVWKSGHPVWGVLVGFGLVTCFVVTLAGGTGTIANRAAGTEAAQTGLSTKYKDDRDELTRVERDRAALPQARPAGAIEGEIAAKKRDRRYDATIQCTDATAKASRDFCASLDSLSAELATAKEAARLDSRADELRSRLRKADPAAYKKANAPAAALARILGTDAETAEAYYALGVSLALELGAMLVMLAAELVTGRQQQKPAAVAVKAVEPALAKPAAPRGRNVVALPKQQTTGSVGRFAEACFVASPGAEIEVAEIYLAYRKWCAGEGYQPHAAAPFADSLRKLLDQLDIEPSRVDGEHVYLPDIGVDIPKRRAISA